MIHFLGGMKKSSKMSKASKKISKPGEISTALRLRCHHDEVKKGKGEANPRRMAALLVEHLEAGKMVPPWENRYHGTLLNGVDDLFKGPPFSKIPPFSLWIVAWFLSWNLWRFLLLWLLTHTHLFNETWTKDVRQTASNKLLSLVSWQMKIFEKSPPSGYELHSFSHNDGSSGKHLYLKGNDPIGGYIHFALNHGAMGKTDSYG